jgi:hypothetical protein
MEKETVSDEMQVIEYMDQMNEKEKKACAIAMEHLGTSFDIIKSNGYLNWKKK